MLAWGKPTIVVKALEVVGSIYRILHTPVEDTTSFERADGDAKEAYIEGHELEGYKTSKGDGTLTMDIRVLKGHKKPFADRDGVVSGTYEVFVQPEDASVPGGIHIPRASVSAKEKFSAADGTLYTYTFKALAPDTDEPMAQPGKVTFTKDQAGKITAVDFEPLAAEAETEEEESSSEANA